MHISHQPEYLLRGIIPTDIFTLAHKYICTMILFAIQFVIVRMELIQMSIKWRLVK